MTVIDPGVGEPASLLADTLAAIKPPDEAAMSEARQRQERLALPIVWSAARVLHDVATFDSAGVSGAKD